MAQVALTWDISAKPVAKAFARRRNKTNNTNLNKNVSDQNATKVETANLTNNLSIISEIKKDLVKKSASNVNDSLFKQKTDTASTDHSGETTQNKNKFRANNKHSQFAVKPKEVKTKKDFIKNSDSNPNHLSPERKTNTVPTDHFRESAQNKDKFSTKLPQSTNKHSLFSVKPKEVYIDTHKSGKSFIESVFSNTCNKFSNLKLHEHLISNLGKNAFDTLTNVQEKAIPVIISGKNVMIRSQTGSGKTLTYVVPIIDALLSLNPRLQRSDGIQALIIVPTRELVLQVHNLFQKLNTFQWIIVSYLSGGEKRKTEKDRLKKGVHVLVSTPGRLLDHIVHTQALKLNNIRCLVLDEADRLLDMGFKKDVVRIVEEIEKAKSYNDYDPLVLLRSNNAEKNNNDSDNREISDDNTSNGNDDDGVPLRNRKSKQRQTILLSATVTKCVNEIAELTMKNHEYIDAFDDNQNGKINLENDFIIPNTVRQEFIITYAKYKLFTLSAVLLAKSKSKSKVFVFMATSQMVDYHYDLFRNYLTKIPKKSEGNGVVSFLSDDENEDEDEDCTAVDLEFYKLHGSMDQDARKKVISAFIRAEKGILICTDVVARGIDVPEADCIIQYTGPASDDDYLHRVGRTGRAGKSGYALIFLTHEEQEYVTRLQKHKVFLRKCDENRYLKSVCEVLDEPDQQKALSRLQHHYEEAVLADKQLYRSACLAFSSWSRFYNSYSIGMRNIFNFHKINTGHYVTSFALCDPPSKVVGYIRKQADNQQLPHQKQFNPKLTIDQEVKEAMMSRRPKRQIGSISLTTSEYGDGFQPKKKKKNKKNTN